MKPGEVHAFLIQANDKVRFLKVFRIGKFRLAADGDSGWTCILINPVVHGALVIDHGDTSEKDPQSTSEFWI